MASDRGEHAGNEPIAPGTMQAERLRRRSPRSLHQQPPELRPSSRQTRLDDILGYAKAFGDFGGVPDELEGALFLGVNDKAEAAPKLQGTIKVRVFEAC